MRWVTREQIAVDRMTCAELMRTLLDRDAASIFVPDGTQRLPKDAEPFDLPGVRLSHRGGHSSFHTMLEEYHLNDPVLERIARLVDEAAVVQEVTLELAAPDLDRICRSLPTTSCFVLERNSHVFSHVSISNSAVCEHVQLYYYRDLASHYL